MSRQDYYQDRARPTTFRPMEELAPHHGWVAVIDEGVSFYGRAHGSHTVAEFGIDDAEYPEEHVFSLADGHMKGWVPLPFERISPAEMQEIMRDDLLLRHYLAEVEENIRRRGQIKLLRKRYGDVDEQVADALMPSTFVHSGRQGFGEIVVEYRAGRLLAKQAIEMIDRLGHPTPFLAPTPASESGDDLSAVHAAIRKLGRVDFRRLVRLPGDIGVIAYFKTDYGLRSYGQTSLINSQHSDFGIVMTTDGRIPREEDAERMLAQANRHQLAEAD